MSRLHHVAAQGDLSQLRNIIPFLTSKDIDETDADGVTPFMLAVVARHFKVGIAILQRQHQMANNKSLYDHTNEKNPAPIFFFVL